MITLPSGLENFMQGKDLSGLKPFAYLFRNKWVEESESGESGDIGSHYELDTTPIDISALIVKPNTLSMTLDVNEVAQYNANNVTLTLSDTKNYFVEGTPNSYFPEGYQLYGSRVVLYYGTDDTNKTALFTGVIKDLPTYKPEQYQVDLKLVSPLEMLKDIEAKDFSDKVIGEELHYEHQDDDSHRIYSTAGTGVGGFDAVYADGNKLFEGVDYETDQMNALGLPALVTIINDDLQNATITADYYTWKTGLTVEQIVAGLVGLAGYNSGTEDIRNVVWNSEIRTQEVPTDLFSLGYSKNGGLYSYAGAGDYCYGGILPASGSFFPAPSDYPIRMTNIFPSNFEYEINLSTTPEFSFGLTGQTNLFLGNDSAYFLFSSNYTGSVKFAYVDVNNNINDEGTITTTNDNKFFIKKNGNTVQLLSNLSYIQNPVYEVIISWNINTADNIRMINKNFSYGYPIMTYQKLTDLDTNIYLENYGVALKVEKSAPTTWIDIYAQKSTDTAPTLARYRTSNDGQTFSAWSVSDIGATIGETSTILQFTLEMATHNAPTDLLNVGVYYLSTQLTLGFVNLTGKTVLEALQDFALISGYEFGVDRNGVFFFRPRVASTTPTYILDHDQIVKVDTVKKNLSDFFTKLTLTFAQVPLEFYANSGPRPNLVDKYGVINKEIDKPDIVNYENPELAQAIGPQLLEVYSSLPNIIQVTGKLNLALELGDIVSLRRNMNLITPDNYTDYSKYTDLNTYYRACKITGMNYNFAKRQITYTLRDVSNKNTEPQYEFNEYIYDYEVQFGVKE